MDINSKAWNKFDEWQKSGFDPKSKMDAIERYIEQNESLGKAREDIIGMCNHFIYELRVSGGADLVKEIVHEAMAEYQMLSKELVFLSSLGKKRISNISFTSGGRTANIKSERFISIIQNAIIEANDEFYKVKEKVFHVSEMNYKPREVKRPKTSVSKDIDGFIQMMFIILARHITGRGAVKNRHTIIADIINILIPSDEPQNAASIKERRKPKKSKEVKEDKSE